MSSSNGSGTFNPVTSFPLRLSLPLVYPETANNPFIFHMRVQMVDDAEEVQKNFVMLPDAEQKGEAFHKYDVEMLALLSTKAPEGFPDFPEGNESNDLPQMIRNYFFPDNIERREGMRFICRKAMAMYYRAIQPDQYL